MNVALCTRWALPVLAFACSGNQAADSDSSFAPESPAKDLLPFVSIARGNESGVVAARSFVIREPGAWESRWREHARVFDPAPPAPGVDFAREMVVAYFRGTQPGSGFSTEIEEITSEEGRIVVRVELQNPTGSYSRVLTQPFHMVRLARSESPVAFEVTVGQGEAEDGGGGAYNGGDGQPGAPPPGGAVTLEGTVRRWLAGGSGCLRFDADDGVSYDLVGEPAGRLDSLVGGGPRRARLTIVPDPFLRSLCTLGPSAELRSFQLLE